MMRVEFGRRGLIILMIFSVMMYHSDREWGFLDWNGRGIRRHVKFNSFNEVKKYLQKRRDNDLSEIFEKYLYEIGKLYIQTDYTRKKRSETFWRDIGLRNVHNWIDSELELPSEGEPKYFSSEDTNIAIYK
mgnify:CR=1 FL=1